MSRVSVGQDIVKKRSIFVMNNGKFVEFLIFAIGLVLLVGSNAQVGYDYDNGSYDSGSNSGRNGGGRIVSVPSTSSSLTANRNDAYQNTAQFNQGRPSNQFASTGGSRPSQVVSQDYNTNSGIGYQNNNGLVNQRQPIQQNSGIYSTNNNNNVLSQPLQTQNQNSDYSQSDGYQNSGQSTQVRPRPSVSTDNNYNSGQYNQGRPTLQSGITNQGSNTNNFGQGSFNRPSLQSQQTNNRDTIYNNNDNNDNSYQNNPQTNQKRPTNEFTSGGNEYSGSSNQRITTRSPQLSDSDTAYNSNGNTNGQNNGQWNSQPTKNKGTSGLGIIASNDGFVNPRPSQDRNTNPYANIENKPTFQSNQNRPTSQVQTSNSFGGVSNSRPSQTNDYNTNDYSGSGNNYRPINKVEGNSNNRPNNGNQFYDSDSYEDSHESSPAHKVNKNNNGNNNKNKNKNNNGNNGNNGNKGNNGNNGNNGNKGNNGNNGNNGNSNNGNGNGNNRNGNKNGNDNLSGEKHSNSKNNNNRFPQTSAGHQGSKTTTKPNINSFINSSRNNGNDKPKTPNNGGNPKKRVSQIKYEQYLSSIFPDLDDKDVQEVTDFKGRKLARPGQFPHMGAIGFKNKVLNKTEYKCGASLISDIWTITTAHCTDNNGLKPTYVRFGDLNLKAAEEDVDPQTRRISLIVNHPSYRDDSLYNDIALLQLNKVVLFTEFVQPIRIWYRDEIPFTMAYAMGFGAVEFAGAQTNRLTQLDLTIIPNDVCARQMPEQTNAKRGIISSQICAIDNKKTGSDTFQGDSGGPLQISFFGEEGGRPRHYLIGMTSFGVVGTTRLPGVYTRVSSFVDWIEKTVWSADYIA
ncbi:probable serine/threonine-protein kinase clkA [Episyrphus balteatus]|uniref:probable serine/threonine-protein kinase clkA n=1 Tax=Episyrphus balteatus TaxID=286459 RepID=UPI002485F50F|nr:probable serine/threonine-protein kinase clkA [Episyrphus balteatus]